MHISENMRSYDEPTCLLVADRLHARFYKAEKREVEFVEEKINDRLTVGDSERYSSQGGNGPLFQSKDEQLDDRESLTFYKSLAQELFAQKQKKAFTKLIVVVPGNDKNMLIDTLHPEVKQLVELVIPKELTRLADDQLIEKIDEARQ